MLPDPVALAIDLVQSPSVTPSDHGCQEILLRHLEAMGFAIHRCRFGQVENFYARLGHTGQNFCFAGHTDVVTPGDQERWQAPPFAGTILDGQLIARGICDMKGALAAMVTATARFLAERPDFARDNSLSFLVTGDEEGDAVDGTVRILEWLGARGEKLDYCLVGEPTSTATLGDGIKNGRRGSLNGRLRVQGIQGHVAYPHLAINPIHAAVTLLAPLVHHVFDTGNADFSPTSLQLTSIQAGGPATNVIPDGLMAAFNIRFNTEQTPGTLERTLRQILDTAVAAEDARLTYTLDLAVTGLPFQTSGGSFLAALRRAVQAATGSDPQLSTGGGTSDARFIARVCPQTVEFGLVGTTMHKINEQCPIADLERLTRVYHRLLQEIFPKID
ncbi:MAG: succinyl-diaminopimelate desuccinylase [Magnetococcales bacterium]|nr:succinyl-diaminopimelate desuccinylase [Magnetococcales bacterium]MBF0323173.1 succinyl-diaminopimelate desuccinylase [Magnetococcales bacterium]